MKVSYQSAADANSAVSNNESITVSNSTSGANGTWSAIEICSGTTTIVLFAKAGSNCNCSGNFNIGEDGDFFFNNAGITCSYDGTGSLPVEWGYFEASINQNHIELRWNTLFELNNEQFIIERSVDGKNFNEIGRISGAGTVNHEVKYSFIDREPLISNNYYRIAQVDFNGKMSYSDLIQTEIYREKSKINLIKETDGVRIKTDESLLQMQILTLDGKIIQIKNCNDLLSNDYYLNFQGRKTGFYLFRVIYKSGSVETWPFSHINM